jgi:hypothetical protein
MRCCSDAEAEEGAPRPPQVIDSRAGRTLSGGGIPKFPQDDLKPWQTVRVHFKDEEGMKSFSDLVGQEITPITKMIWYPKAAIGSVVTKRVRELIAESLKGRPSVEVDV